jgi:HEAT repeat protein
MLRILGPLCVSALLVLPAAADEESSSKRIAALIEKLGDEEFMVRDQARKDLEKIGEPAWDALVQARAKHSDLEVRLQARRVLTVILDVRLPRLIKELGDKKRQDASKELSKLLDAPGETAQQETTKAALVVAMKRHKDAVVRMAATDVLRRGYAERIKKLIEQLGDDAFVELRDPYLEMVASHIKTKGER